MVVPAEKSVLVAGVDVAADRRYVSGRLCRRSCPFSRPCEHRRTHAPPSSSKSWRYGTSCRCCNALDRVRLQLATTDRCVWVMLSRLWTGWRTALVIVKPETVIAWHRRRLPAVVELEEPVPPRATDRARQYPDADSTMAQANPRWGAPRIHRELLKLGIDVCQATVAKIHGLPPPAQTWRTFLPNHIGQIVPADFFVVPTVTYRLLSVLVLLAHDRRRIRHIAVTAHPTAAWTAQQLREALWDETLATCSTIAIMRSTASGPWRLKKCSRHRGRLGKMRSSSDSLDPHVASVSTMRSCSTRSAAPHDPLLFVLRTVPHAFIAGQRHRFLLPSRRRAMVLPSSRSRKSVACIIATNGARPEHLSPLPARRARTRTPTEQLPCASRDDCVLFFVLR
jgi:hypothetical protein